MLRFRGMFVVNSQPVWLNLQRRVVSLDAYNDTALILFSPHKDSLDALGVCYEPMSCRVRKCWVHVNKCSSATRSSTVCVQVSLFLHDANTSVQLPPRCKAGRCKEPRDSLSFVASTESDTSVVRFVIVSFVPNKAVFKLDL